MKYAFGIERGRSVNTEQIAFGYGMRTVEDCSPGECEYTRGQCNADQHHAPGGRSGSDFPILHVFPFCLLRMILIREIRTLPIREPHDGRRINNQRDTAIAHDRGARNHIDAPVEFPEGLDYRLVRA